MPRIDGPIPENVAQNMARNSHFSAAWSLVPRYTETADASPEHRRPTNKRRSLRDKDNYLSMNPGVMTDVLPRPTIPLLVFTLFFFFFSVSVSVCFFLPVWRSLCLYTYLSNFLSIPLSFFSLHAYLPPSTSLIVYACLLICLCLSHLRRKSTY